MKTAIEELIETQKEYDDAQEFAVHFRKTKDYYLDIEKTQIEKYKNKAEKYDELMREISKFYLDEDGEFTEDNPENTGDLCDIGEIAASHFGFI